MQRKTLGLCTYACTHMHTHSHMHVCMCALVHTCAHAHTHACTHAHAHTVTKVATSEIHVTTAAVVSKWNVCVPLAASLRTFFITAMNDGSHLSLRLSDITGTGHGPHHGHELRRHPRAPARTQCSRAAAGYCLCRTGYLRSRSRESRAL